MMSAQEEIERLGHIIHSYTTFFLVFDLIVFVAVITAIVLAINFLKSKKRFEKTSEYLRAAIKGQEDERAKISRELHDTVAQDLRYCKNLAEQLKDSASLPATDKEKVENIYLVLKKSLFQVRAMSGNLVPPDITKNDLVTSLMNLCQSMNGQPGENGGKLEIRLVEDGEIDTSFLSEEAKLNLYRITQESLMNVLNHAEASEAIILIRNALENEAEGIYIFISDDGKGFDTEKPVLQGHFGLAGMEERARLIGAKLKITSAPDEGTQVAVSLCKKNNPNYA